jgi:hypothetical protein
MRKIRDRHYETDPGELVTVSLDESVHVGSVIALGRPLPITVPGRSGGLMITVAFSGPENGRAVIRVTGSASGSAVDVIPQLGDLPVNHGSVIID